MSKNNRLAKFIYLIGIILLGVTALFTLASGLGTICVAWNPKGFGESMALLAPFQWLYILYVVITTLIGIGIASAFVLFIKRNPSAYSRAVLALIAGVLVGILHIITSRALRGKSMPVDAVVYTTILTLLVFLLFRIRAIREQIFSLSPEENKDTLHNASLITLLLTGLLTLTIPIWLGGSHTWGGMNWAAAFLFLTNGLGLLQIFSALGLFLWKKRSQKHPAEHGGLVVPGQQSTKISLQ